MSTRLLVLCRRRLPSTPDGHQVAGLAMFASALRRKLGVEVELVTAMTLDAIEAQLTNRPADIAMVMPHWSEPADQVVALFQRAMARPRRPRLVMMDYYAPTTSPFFGVLPYVDRFLKRQTLRNREDYFRPWTGGNPVAHFMVASMGYEGLGDWSFGSAPTQRDLSKVMSMWNLGVAPRYRWLLRASRLLPGRWRERPFALHLRLGVDRAKPPKQWYQWYRRRTLEAMDPVASRHRCTGESRVSTRRYLWEMLRSRIVVSPFGWGEVCFRDYEAVSCGALLVKPDMSHLQTAPDIYQPHQTYVPVRWDLTDLESVCEHYLAHPELAEPIVRRARAVLAEHLLGDGFVHEVQRCLSGLLPGEAPETENVPA